MNLVVGIWIETTETIVAGVIADVAANDVAVGVLQEDHRGGQGRFPLVGDEPVDRAQLGFVLGILLRYSNRCEQDEGKSQAEQAQPQIHFFPPAAGCISKTTLSSLMPLLALILLL